MEEKECLISKESSKSINTNGSLTKKVINFYKDLQEISYITPLIKIKCRMIINILLNILTLGIFNKIISQYPKAKIKLLYEESDDLDEANYISIHDKNGKISIVKLYREEKKYNIDDDYIDLLEKLLNENINNAKDNNKVKYIISISNLFRSGKFIYFEYKYRKYFYDSKNENFIYFNLYESFNNRDKDIINSFTIPEIIKASDNLNENEKRLNNILFNSNNNFLIKPNKNIFIIFFQILYKNYFLYLYLFFSVFYLYYTNYKIYSFLVLGLSLLIIIIEIVEKKKKLNNYNKYCQFANKGNYKNLTLFEKFEIPDKNEYVPCDCLLLNGTVILNELKLTGTQNEVYKNEISKNEINGAFSYEKYKENILFMGSKIIDKTNGKLYAIALGVNYNARIGNIIKLISNHNENTNKGIINDIKKYVLFLFILFIIGAIYTFYLLKYYSGLQNFVIFIRIIDLIIILIPPIFPIILKLFYRYSLLKLTFKNDNKVNKPFNTINTIIIEDNKANLKDNSEEEKKKYYSIKPVKLNKENNFSNAINNNFDENINLDSSDRILAFSLLSPSNNIINYVKNLNIGGKYVEFDSEKEISNFAKDVFKKNLQKLNAINSINDDFICQLIVECLVTCNKLHKVNNDIFGNMKEKNILDLLKWDFISESKNEKIYRPSQEIKQGPSFKYSDNTINNESFSSARISDAEEIIKIGQNNKYELHVFKTYENEGEEILAVLTNNPNEDKIYKLFFKGLPEVISKLCNNQELPKDYKEEVKNYRQQGYIVYSLAYKIIENCDKELIKNLKIEGQHDINYLGLLLYKNDKIKELAENLNQINNDNFCVVSNNNFSDLFAYCKQYNIINNEGKLLKYDLSNDSHDFIEVDSGSLGASLNILNSINDIINIHMGKNLKNEKKSNNNEEPKIPLFKFRLYDYQKNENEYDIHLKNHSSTILCIKGNEFDYLYDEKNKYLINKLKKQKSRNTPKFNDKDEEDLAKNYLKFLFVLHFCKIYYNMNKDQQLKLFNSMKEQNEAKICKHICKLSIDQENTEDSFISKEIQNKQNDLCVNVSKSKEEYNLIKNINEYFFTQCNLNVSFTHIFKFSIVSSFLKFISVLILTYFNTYISRNQFFIIDFIIIIPMIIIDVAFTKNAQRVKIKINSDKKKNNNEINIPSNDDDNKSINLMREFKPKINLLSAQNIFSLMFQFVIVFLFQILLIIFIRKQKFYRPKKFFENYIIFISTCIINISLYINLSIGYPIKKSIYKNLAFDFYLLFIIISLFIVLFDNPISIIDELDLTDKIYDIRFKITFVVLFVIFHGVSLIFEKVVLRFIFKSKLTRKNK